MVASRGRYPDNPSDRKRKLKGISVQMLEIPVQTGKSFTLTTVTKDNYVLEYEIIG